MSLRVQRKYPFFVSCCFSFLLSCPHLKLSSLGAAWTVWDDAEIPKRKLIFLSRGTMERGLWKLEIAGKVLKRREENSLILRVT